MNKIKYHVVSFLLHVMLVLVILLRIQFNVASQSVVLGDAETKTVASYIYKNNKVNQTIAHKIVAIKAENALALQKKLQPQHSEENSSSSHGEQTEALLAVLHAAIQKQQHYPISAMQMEREGRATMAFVLLPDGRIQNLHLVKSSGTDSLDQAAAVAIQNAVPFAVDNYLKTAKEFSIDVVFELA